jgi:hypothetical protein
VLKNSVSRSLSKGVVHAAEEESCNLIVMGFAGKESPQTATLMDDVIYQARTDIILLKVRGEFHPKRIAVSLGGSSNINLIVRLAGNLADRFDGQIDFLNILPTDYSVEQKSYSTRIIVEAIKQHMAKALYRIELASSDTPNAAACAAVSSSASQMNHRVHPFSGNIFTTVRSKILPPGSSWRRRTVSRRPSAKSWMHSG